MIGITFLPGRRVDSSTDPRHEVIPHLSVRANKATLPIAKITLAEHLDSSSLRVLM